MPKKTVKDLTSEVQELRAQLEEALETLNAIRRGEIDGLVVTTPKGEQIYTLSGAETPYRLLIEEMKEGALMLSDNNIILYANKGFAKIVKHPLVEIVGKNIEIIVAPTHLSTFKEILYLSRSRKDVVENEIALKAKDNSLVPVHVSVALLTKHDPKTTLLIATDLTQHMEEQIKKYTINLERDITERKKAEEKIHQQNIIREGTRRIFQEALGSSEGALGEVCLLVAEEVTQSKFGFIGNINESGLEDIAISNPGWDACRVIASEGHRIPVGSFKIHGIYGKVISEGKGFFTNDPVNYPGHVGLPVGHPPLKSFLGVPLLSEGKIIGIVAVGNREGGYGQSELEALEALAPAIVESFLRKRAEKNLEEYKNNLEKLVEERTKQLKDSERLAAIGATAGMVGHDIRNPLQAIAGDLYLIDSDIASLNAGEIKESLQESTKSILGNLQYIAKIVEDLQDFAKPLKPQYERLRIDKIIEDVMLLTPVASNHQVVIDIEKDPPYNTADFSMMKRILSNLVLNALQAMPDGGQLAIQAYQKDAELFIAVKDTGVGIPEEIKPKLFTPMMTTKSKGQGLGLAVVKRLIEAQGGTITFESEVGKGTTFIVRLPPPQRAKR